MNAEAYFVRLERRTTVLFLLLLVQAVVMFVFWAVTPAPAEPPVLPVKDVPAELGSKGNPIECLYVNKLVVMDGVDSPERITLEVKPNRFAQLTVSSQTGYTKLWAIKSSQTGMLVRALPKGAMANSVLISVCETENSDIGPSIVSYDRQGRERSVK